MKGATFIQNNFPAGERGPDKPVMSRPGSHKKLAVMQQRVAARLSACNPEDSNGMDDEE